MTEPRTPGPASEPAPAPERPRRAAWEHELGPERPPGEAEPAAEAEKAASDRPARDRSDELLPDPPALPALGALSGYREGRGMRRWLVLALIAGIAMAVYIGRRYMEWLEEQASRPPTPAYQLAEGGEAESRPDALVWTDGTARLGLSRQDPGVKAIVLPDRVLTLAPGCDHAQVNVEVKDGRTVRLKVLVGEIEQTSLRADPPL